MAWKSDSPDYPSWSGARVSSPVPAPILIAESVRASFCVKCGEKLEQAFAHCPACGHQVQTVSKATNIRYKCGSCKKPLDDRWKHCPFCSKAVAHRPVIIVCDCQEYILELNQVFCGGCGHKHPSSSS